MESNNTGPDGSAAQVRTPVRTAVRSETDLPALQVRAKSAGLVLHCLRDEDGTTAYLIARGGMAKELPGLDAGADFLNRWEGQR